MFRYAVLPTLTALTLLSTLPAGAAGKGDPHHGWCGTERLGAWGAVARHREQVVRAAPVKAAATPADSDVGNVAVLQDAGDLVLLRHLLDLQGAGLQFTPQATGFSVSRVDRPVAADPGTRLALGDDTNTAVRLPFSFPFFGRSFSEVFVNSDGNLTLGAGESASTSRSIGRLLSGPPRIAPLFADLNPEDGGSITVFSDASRASLTWTDVPQFGDRDRNTFQVTLYPDGHIDFTYDKGVSTVISEGVIGVAPGNNERGLTGVDFSAAAAVTGPGALAESFHENDDLDAVAVTRRFLATHRDDYQQVVIFTSRRLGRSSGYFAYELTVKNTDAGIGAALVDYTAEFGSSGRLESFVTMDFIGKYPEDPERVFFGTDSSLSIMGQEVGHRWGAYALFRDADRVSNELLGRDGAHWSFFMDSDASHLEGNDIQDLGGGRFQTVGGTLRYSALDQYLMGIRGPEEVAPFFFVRNPVGTETDSGRSPELNVSFTGVRKDVTIGDVIAALGARNPAPGPRPPFRQAFVYVDAGGTDAAAAIAKVEKLRATWEPFFARSTEGRGTVDTHLN